MAVKSSNKKANLPFGSDIAGVSLFQEDFDRKLAECKAKLENDRKEKMAKFAEFEAQYSDTCAEGYKEIFLKLIKILGLEPFPELKEAMQNEKIVQALNRSKKFEVIFADEKAAIEKVLDFLAEDELVREALMEKVKAVRKEYGFDTEETAAEEISESEIIE